MTSWWSGSVCVGWMIVFGARQAEAAPPGEYARGVHVVQLVAGNEDDGAAIRLTKGLEQAVLDDAELPFINTNKALLEGLAKGKCGEVLAKKALSLRTLSEGDERGVDGVCLERIAAYIGGTLPPASRYLWGTVYRDASNQPWASVHLWERGQPDRVATVAYPSSSAAKLVSERIVARLFSPTKTGEVHVTSERPLQGEVFVNGKASGRFDPSASDLITPVGIVRVEVRDGSKVVARGEALVHAGQMSSVRLTTLATASTPERDKTAPLPSATASSSGSDWRVPMGLVGLGVGVVALGVGVVSNVQVKNLREELTSDAAYARLRKDVRTEPPCDVADRTPGALSVASTCSTQRTFRTLRTAGYVAGGVSLAVGAGLLLWSALSPKQALQTKSGWTVTPWASSSSGQLTVQGAF